MEKSIKSFEEYVSDIDKAKQIEYKNSYELNSVEREVEDVKDDAESKQVSEAGEAPTETEKAETPESAPKKDVSDLLKECYEILKEEAKAWQDDAHDEHTIESYMVENAALVARLAVETLDDMKSDMKTEAHESCLNRMIESYTKKINESKDMRNAEDAQNM